MSHSSLVFRALGLLLSAGCVTFGVLPLLQSRLHVGCVVLIGVGTVGAAVCLWWRQTTTLWNALWQTAVGRIALSVLTAAVAVVLVLFAAVSVMMAVAACNQPPENATVVVLGAGLRGDQPSRILRERLNAAADYLEAHPQAVAILSGGQGADEWCTEASVMKTYLLNKGIPEERLYVEDRSTSTFENLGFSKQLIEREGLSSAVALVTQEFHQCRAQTIARRHGFTEVGAITATTQWELFLSYWIRDFAGLCHLVVFGR